MESYKQELISKIKTLSETIWEHKLTESSIIRWLDNFNGKCFTIDEEKISALFMLSQFMYFGNREMREILKALYRDLYKYPIVAQIRRDNKNTTDLNKITKEFSEKLAKTKFLGVGNPSESGTHLLYYFRQENSLPKTNFIHTHHIFKRQADLNKRSCFLKRRTGLKLRLRFPDVERYIFVDDLCGSGSQAVEYSEDIVEDLKRLNQDAFVSYYVMFASKKGLEKVRKETKFDSVEAIYELDESYECFNENSRYFVNNSDEINKDNVQEMFTEYGKTLWGPCPLGYKNSQLFLGFYHNIPDNTLPVIWAEEQFNGDAWFPIFKRYPKIYS